MKRIFVFAAAVLALFLLCSCGEKEKEKENGFPNVVCTVFPQYDFTRNIARGADINIKMLLPAGSEAHSYEPSPSDIKAINDCDLFIWVGGESEAWAKKLIASSELDGEKVLSLMEVTGLLHEEEGLAGEKSGHHDHDGDHSHGEDEYDEHVWTSPKNAIKIAEAICEKLCAVSPENSEVFRENTENYTEELRGLDAGFERVSENSNGKKLVIGDRFPFLYLAHEYGFSYISAFSGCAEQTEASLAVISELIETVKRDKIPIVFAVDFSSGKLAKTIAYESGAEVLRLYSCHTVSVDDMKKGEDYISLMTKNLQNIEKAVLN